MASPTIESLCCLTVENRFSKNYLADFQTIPYNLISVLTSALGIGGSLYQILPLENSSFDTRNGSGPPSKFLRTRSRYIIKWLAVSDLFAASGIIIRSIFWLIDETFGTPDSSDASGQIFCIISSGCIHFFYTATYLWTLIYAIDMKFIIQEKTVSFKTYHIVGWTVPAALCLMGLMFLYLPDLNCHSSTVNPYLRFLPNYLSTFLPILFVMSVNPVLYILTFSSVENLLTTARGRFTQSERKIVQSLKAKFFFINAVFYICWLPNIVNGIILWTSWNALPKETILIIWYFMAILNPLQAVFNCLVYRNWNDVFRIRCPAWINPRQWFRGGMILSEAALKEEVFSCSTEEAVVCSNHEEISAETKSASFFLIRNTESIPLLPYH